MHGYTKLVVWQLLLSSLSSYFGHGISDSDLQCLKDFKQSLIDPNGILEAGSENESPWNFTDSPMCDFIGVVCWNPFEDRVLSLRLGNLGLEGPFPRGLELCTSMTALDLSGNNFSGPLPERISEQMPYVSFLDLSNNSFSGGIPASIMNMTYLNVLALQHNQFAGGIPAVNLSRLISFDVADNSLTGPVPDSLQRFPAGNFTGNLGLCGTPLDKKCKKRFRVRIHVRLVTNGFICRFTGVECWHPDENRVLSLCLGNLGLEGPFPQGLKDCTSMTGLDLSKNKFSGPIPSDLLQLVQPLTSLDLSYNGFSGSIPQSISDMTYLNLLNLQHNQFSGQIPPQFNRLTRLRTFNVVGNLLSGPIPNLLEAFPASNFVSNQGLCGSPLDDCPPLRRRWRPVRIRLHRIYDQSSIGAAVGFVVGFVVAFYFPHCFICSERLRAYVVRI